jgi:hypothetical protein
MSLALDKQCKSRTGLYCSLRMGYELGRQWPLVEDRVAPLVECDPLWQKLGAHAVGLTGDRVQAYSLAHPRHGLVERSRIAHELTPGVAIGRLVGSGSSGWRAQASQAP